MEASESEPTKDIKASFAPLAGQWIGTAQGTSFGSVVCDLDEVEEGYSGHAYLFDEGPGVPHSVVKIVLPNKRETEFEVRCPIFALHPQHPMTLNALDLARDFQGVTFPQSALIQLKLKDQVIDASWITNIETGGAAQLNGSKAATPSALPVIPNVFDWASFKQYAMSLPYRGFVFRGQGKPHRLRTSFHRTRRKDLINYLNIDIPNAHHVLTAQTKHLFKLTDNLENAAFFNLLQHHGYPTPLLDWTYSPFVAAFFAYRFRRDRSDNDKSVRILVFDKVGWQASFEPIQAIAYGRPHFSLLEPLSIENPRALPQQSVSSVTNLDDIESYVITRGSASDRTFLRAVDLPFAERRSIMRELSMMDITAGSLFPGLDGACEELRGRFFHPFD